MNSRRRQGQEELQRHLTSDGLFDLLRLHADLLHDLKALPILVALGDLLVIDDQNGREQADKTQQDPKEQEGTVHIQDVVQGFPFGIEGIAQRSGIGSSEFVDDRPGERRCDSADSFLVREDYPDAVHVLAGICAVSRLLRKVNLLQRVLIRNHDPDDVHQSPHVDADRKIGDHFLDPVFLSVNGQRFGRLPEIADGGHDPAEGDLVLPKIQMTRIRGKIGLPFELGVGVLGDEDRAGEFLRAPAACDLGFGQQGVASCEVGYGEHLFSLDMLNLQTIFFGGTFYYLS